MRMDHTSFLERVEAVKGGPGIGGGDEQLEVERLSLVN